MIDNTTVSLSDETLKGQEKEALYETFQTSSEGLTSDEALKRLETFGSNALEEKKTSLWMQLFHYFWGPIPWMIEVAAILSILVQHWDDFIIIMVLLIFNALIGFWEEHKAQNALDALKKGLAIKARAKRGKKWKEVDASKLVPGDIIRIRLGDILPADVILIEGDYLSIDQSALTGESLPVSKREGDIGYSGSIAKQGEMIGLVVRCGSKTFFG
ncbi:HAD-IC family P-type ATPase, partial [Chlamydiales bacterium]|nr:HAD-IC family P-type ATPase [Chlamydiales bacterium]